MTYRTAALSALGALACAAHSADLPPTLLEPVVVTDTRFETRAVDRPVNVTVITEDAIRQSTARTVPDLLAEQAGIIVRDLFGNNAANATVDLRGFGVTGGQNTLILVDGRRVTDIDLSGVQWSAVPLPAIERIEIVRGGASVLYGDGATAGVINIITKSPIGRADSLALRGAAGSYQTREGVIEGNFARGSFGMNVIGTQFESDGYRRNNQQRQTNAMADLRWSGASDDLSLKLATDNQGLRLPGARTVQPSIGQNQLETDRRGTNTPLDWGQREGNRASLDWRRTFGFGELDIGAGYRDKAQRAFFDFGGFPDYRATRLDVWSLTPRVRIDTPLFGRANSLIVGFDWYRWDYEQRRSNSTLNIVQPVNAVDAKQDNTAVYVLNTTSVTDALAVRAGARRERLRIRATDRFDPSAPCNFPGFCGSGASPGSRRLYQTAYELGARYQVVPAAALIAKTARSYRFANIDELYETSTAFTNEFQFLQPQTVRSHEAGIELRRGTTTGRATVFVMDVSNEIHLDPFTTGVGNRNLPPSRRRGIELEAGARPLPALGITANYMYIDAEFREGVLAGGFFTLQNVAIAGKTVPLVPRHKANVRASWDFTSATRLNALVTYVSDQFMDNDEPNSLGARIPSYTLVDLKLVHQRGPWTITAGVNNLFDRKYYNYAVRSQFVLDRYNAYPLPQRNGMVSVEYRL
ncbi:MAG TPA: TonB-dependent receptor [Burkholderiales bacterium]|nr:TonB-dependent receptor [Burkholderiales bacterium]